MFAFIYSSLLLLAAGGGSFYNDYLNIPGFEAWKFLNLAIFIAVLYFLLRKPLSSAFKAKRESIRAELIRAEEEKQAALDRLATAEAKLAQLETEKSAILQSASAEAAAEKQRLIDQTAADVKRLRDQADAEVARVAHLTKGQLRKYSAEESVRLAELKLRERIDAQKDSELVKTGIRSIGGMN
jgi:F-type H+-transporting ATPase subunit b